MKACKLRASLVSNSVPAQSASSAVVPPADTSLPSHHLLLDLTSLQAAGWSSVIALVQYPQILPFFHRSLLVVGRQQRYGCIQPATLLWHSLGAEASHERGSSCIACACTYYPRAAAASRPGASARQPAIHQSSGSALSSCIGRAQGPDRGHAGLWLQLGRQAL